MVFLSFFNIYYILIIWVPYEKKSKERFMSKTYLKMIFVSTLLTLFLVVSFTFSAKDIFEKYFTDFSYESNVKELNIISNYIQSNHNMIQKLAYQLSTDSSLDVFLHNVPMKSAEGYDAMMDLSNFIRFNPLIHSISFYSGYTGEYYSTLTSNAKSDPLFHDMIENPDSTAILQPIYRTLPFDIYNTSATVFSYFYFETGSNGKITKAIFVNLDASQLFKYLTNLKGNNSHTYIIDLYNGNVIDDSEQRRELTDNNDSFIQKIIEADSAYGCFTDNTFGDGSLITYQVLSNPQWILITEEPNTVFLNVMHTLQKSLLLIVCILVLGGVIYSLLMFYRLYQPWGKIYQQVASKNTPSASPSRLYDDAQAINHSFQLTQNQLADYMNYKNSTQNALFTSYIRALIQDDVHLIQKFTDSDRVSFDQFLSCPIRTAIFRIDHWHQLKSSLSGSSDACIYSFMQLSGELYPALTDGPAYYWIYLTHGNFLLLVPSSSQTGDDTSWAAQLTILQYRFAAQTGLSVTISIGGSVSNDVSEFVQITRAALERLSYSILFGRQCVLECQLDSRHANACLYDEALERELRNALDKNQIPQALDIFDTILAKYRQCDLQTFILHLTQLFLHLDKHICTMNKSKGLPSKITSFYYIIQVSESLDDIRERFIDELDKLPTHDELANFKTNTLINTIKEYINEHYPEDISLKGISARFNLSSGYLGNLFKTTMGMSVYEYINAVRLDAAAKMLLETNHSTMHIMQQCGFVNESNFYRQFKTRFDVTPKTYRDEKKQRV